MAPSETAVMRVERSKNTYYLLFFLTLAMGLLSYLELAPVLAGMFPIVPGLGFLFFGVVVGGGYRRLVDGRIGLWRYKFGLLFMAGLSVVFVVFGLGGFPDPFVILLIVMSVVSLVLPLNVYRTL